MIIIANTLLVQVYKIHIQFYNMSDIFSTRELSLLIWTTIFIITLTLGKSLRKSFNEVIKTLFVKQFILIYLSMTAYVFLVVLLLRLLNLWEMSFLKDTIFWFFSFAIMTFFSLPKAEDINFFKNLLLESFRWTIFLEFLFNFYTFNLVAELIFLPIITFVALTQAIAETVKKNEQIGNLLSSFLSIIGSIYFFYAFFKTISEYGSFFTSQNLKALILPLLLTISILPFFYFIALYMQYEEIFKRIIYLTDDNDERHKLKQAIFSSAKFDLFKLRIIKQKIKKFGLYHSTDISIYLNSIR